MFTADVQRTCKDTALLFCLTLVVYLKVFNSGFIASYDDEMYITLNPVVSQGVTWDSLKWSLTTFVSGNWHPLTWWSHLIDVSMFGMNPVGHHAMSLAIHIVNMLLIYFFLLRATGIRWHSLAAAALFGVHPLHVESVAWVAERKDVLSSLFALGALHVYLSFVATERLRFYLLMFVLLCCSLMAKPMMVTLPFMLLLLDYWPLERYRNYRWNTLVAEKLPLLLPVAAISAVSIMAQQSVGALKGLADDSFVIRVGNALYAYGIYLKKFIAPYDLASFYPYGPVPSYLVTIAAAVLVGASAAVWRLRVQNPWLLTGWLWFLMSLIPVIGIIRVGEQAYADRYMYLPMVGVSVMLVWGGNELFQRLRVSPVVKVLSIGGMVVWYAIITLGQTGYWKDSESLYARELAVTNNNWHGHFGLANALAKRQEYQEAVRHYGAALAVRPNLVDAHNNLGSALRSLGKHQEAIPHFLKALELNPYYLGAYFNLSLTLMDMGNSEMARQYLRQALVLDPTFKEGRELLEYLER